MKKGGRVFLSSLVVSAVVLTAAFIVRAQAPTEPPKGNIVVKDPAWEKHTKCPVDFTHQTHAQDYKIACTDCHHVYEGGQNKWKEGDPAEKCSKCHTELTIEGEKKLPEDQQKLNLKLAYHGNCVECHKLKKKEDPKSAAPVTCTGCHPKDCPQ